MRRATRRRRGATLLVALGLLGPAVAAPAVGAPPVALDSTPPDVPAWPTAPSLASPVHLLVDAATGTVLSAAAADERRPVASTVKMLTAITVRRLAPDLDATIVVGQEVAGVGGASTGVAPGDTLTVEQLLELLLVRSGNDAAVALAVGTAGSVAGFVAEMRRDAATLGLEGTVLASPSGLEDRNMLSARDLAVVATCLLEDPELARIVDLEQVVVPGDGAAPNRNELVLDDPTVTGVKTGFTTAAGNGVVASAERGGRELVAVVLGAQDPAARFADAELLLDHAGEFAVAAPPPAVVGCAGPDPTVATTQELLVPREVPVGATYRSLGCDGEAGTAVVELDGAPLATVDAEVVRGGAASAPAGPDAALGAAVVDTVQSALRALAPEG